MEDIIHPTHEEIETEIIKDENDYELIENYYSNLDVKCVEFKGYIINENLNEMNFKYYMQALEQNPMRMAEWIEKLDELMKLSGRELLVGNGSITHEQAKQKAIAEFEKYRKLEMLQYESDYDRAIKELIQKENALPKA